MIPDPEGEWWWDVQGFQAKGLESAGCCPFQEESMNDIEMSQHHQGSLWSTVLLLEESPDASKHRQALGQQLAVGDEVAHRITCNRKATLKTKGRGSAAAKCPNVYELNCLVPPMYCSFKTVTVSW